MFVRFLQKYHPTRRAVYRLGRGRAENVCRQVTPWLNESDWILDIGAGTCNVCEILAERDFDVTPVDVEDLSFVDGLRAKIFDGERLPFDDDEFDVALLLAVLHHTEHPERLLAEAARVAPRLIVMEDVCENRLQKYATRAIDSLLNLEFLGHPHTNKSDDEWRRIFAATGLRLLAAADERWLAVKSATYSLERDDSRRASADFAGSASVRKECRSRFSRMIKSRKMVVAMVAAVTIATIAAGGVTLANRAVIAGAQSALVDSPTDVQIAPVVIVLGARVYDDGRLYLTTQDRVDTAVELYRTGKVSKLLITGDHGQESYDEVNSMRRHAVSQGIPARDIFMDHAGFDTYDSMYRARDVFGVKRAIVVTQKFHLARAVYTARALGIDAVGVPADRRVYIKAALFDAREALARAKAFVELAYLRPSPKYLGPAIDITGDGRVTMDKIDPGPAESRTATTAPRPKWPTRGRR